VDQYQPDEHIQEREAEKQADLESLADVGNVDPYAQRACVCSQRNA
jgi:hypothetical protein